MGPQARQSEIWREADLEGGEGRVSVVSHALAAGEHGLAWAFTGHMR